MGCTCRAIARPAGAIGSAGAVASAGAATEHLARGFTGLSIRPNAYVWRVLGTKQVIAPLNAKQSGFPGDPARNFGPSGLSLADDRWDVRQAIAIQGALRERGREYDWLTLYIDTQTQQPLYVITERRRDRRRIGVGILLHRWSGDQPGYPAWPDGTPAAVFDPAAAVFFDESDRSGWRRESYDARSTPLAAGRAALPHDVGFPPARAVGRVRPKAVTRHLLHAACGHRARPQSERRAEHQVHGRDAAQLGIDVADQPRERDERQHADNPAASAAARHAGRNAAATSSAPTIANNTARWRISTSRFGSPIATP